MTKKKAPKPLGLEHGKQKLSNVHSITGCAGHPCPIHNRTDHHMRSFPQHWRPDRCIMERICPHGVGHDDPDCLLSRVRLGREAEGIHGCCGCCGRARRLLADGVKQSKIYAQISAEVNKDVEAASKQGLVSWS